MDSLGRRLNKWQSGRKEQKRDRATRESGFSHSPEYRPELNLPSSSSHPATLSSNRTSYQTMLPSFSPAPTSNPRQSSVIPTLTDGEFSKYSAVFDRLGPSDGLLNRDQVLGLLDKSGLTNDVLKQACRLADREKRGQLDRFEFVIVIHLLNSMITGKITSLPEKLPRGSYEAAASRQAVASYSKLPRNSILRDVFEQPSSTRSRQNQISHLSGNVSTSVSGFPSSNTETSVPTQQRRLPPTIEPSARQIAIYVKEKDEDRPKSFLIYENFLAYHSPVLESLIVEGRDTVKIISDPSIFGLLATWLFDEKLRDKYSCEPLPHVLVHLYVLAYQLQIHELCNQIITLYIRMACKATRIDGPSPQVSKAAQHVYDNIPEEYSNSGLRRLLVFHHAAFRTSAELQTCAQVLPKQMVIDIACFLSDLYERQITRPGAIEDRDSMWRNSDGSEYYVDEHSFMRNGQRIPSTLQFFSDEVTPDTARESIYGGKGKAVERAPFHTPETPNQTGGRSQDPKPNDGLVTPTRPILVQAPGSVESHVPGSPNTNSSEDDTPPVIFSATWEDTADYLHLVVIYELNAKFWDEETTSAAVDLGFGAKYLGDCPTSVQSEPRGRHDAGRSLIFWRLGDITVDRTAKKLEAWLFGENLRPSMVEARWEVNKSRSDHRKGRNQISAPPPNVPPKDLRAKLPCPKILMNTTWTSSPGNLHLVIEYMMDPRGLPEDTVFKTNLYFEVYHTGTYDFSASKGGAVEDKDNSALYWHLEDATLDSSVRQLKATFFGGNAQPYMVEMTWLPGPPLEDVSVQQVDHSFDEAAQTLAMKERRRAQRLAVIARRKPLRSGSNSSDRKIGAIGLDDASDASPRAAEIQARDHTLEDVNNSASTTALRSRNEEKARLAEEQKVEAERLAEEQRNAKAQEAKLRAEKEAKEKRLADESKAAVEKRRLDAEHAEAMAKRVEEQRLAQERLRAKRDEEERIANEKRIEDQRNATKKRLEDERLGKEASEKKRLEAEETKAKRIEEERRAKAMRDEEERQANNKRLEEERLAEEASEKKRLSEKAKGKQREVEGLDAEQKKQPPQNALPSAWGNGAWGNSAWGPKKPVVSSPSVSPFVAHKANVVEDFEEEEVEKPTAPQAENSFSTANTLSAFDALKEVSESQAAAPEESKEVEFTTKPLNKKQRRQAEKLQKEKEAREAAAREAKEQEDADFAGDEEQTADHAAEIMAANDSKKGKGKAKASSADPEAQVDRDQKATLGDQEDQTAGKVDEGTAAGGSSSKPTPAATDDNWAGFTTTKKNKKKKGRK